MSSMLYESQRRRASSTSFTVLADTTYQELNRPISCDIPSLVESVDNNDNNSLTYFAAAMFATILEDTMASMNILEKCNIALHLKKTLLDMDILLEKKYNIKPHVPSEETIRYPLDCDENKIDKMAADRKLCLESLEPMYLEMGLYHKYQHLQKFQPKEDTQANTLLSNDVFEKKSCYRELKRQLRSQRHMRILAKYDCEDRIIRLRNLIMDTEHMSAVKHKYLSDWKMAQTEQHLQIINDSERAAMENISRNKNESDLEVRVHFEVENFNNTLLAEHYRQLDEIMDKYQTDIDKIDIAIQVGSFDHEETKRKRIELENKIAKRQKEMDAWIKCKEERAAAEDLNIKRNEAAKIVQAWWRGILVRNSLGPYKPKKKGRKGKKKA